jgi:hypothetical protein
LRVKDPSVVVIIDHSSIRRITARPVKAISTTDATLDPGVCCTSTVRKKFRPTRPRPFTWTRIVTTGTLPRTRGLASAAKVP